MILAVINIIRKELILGLYALLVPILCITFFYVIPDKKFVQTRDYFYQNRDTLIKQTKSHTRNHREFTPIDHYWSIVFVRNDRPEEIHDTCSGGGHVMSKLEENWYICSRDWN